MTSTTQSAAGIIHLFEDALRRQPFDNVFVRPFMEDAAFGGDEHLVTLAADGFSNDFLCMAVTVTWRGVDEIDAAVDGFFNGGDGVCIVHLAPEIVAVCPCAEADF